MKIIKINDNLKINIEMLYSIEKQSNQNDLDNWDNNYQKYLTKFSEDPPLLPIDDNRTFRIKFNKDNDSKDVELYSIALYNHIKSIIGNKPAYIEKYFIILCTGLKINIDKTIYDKINKYLENYTEDKKKTDT
jgi:hypothetical protein